MSQEMPPLDPKSIFTAFLTVKTMRVGDVITESHIIAIQRILGPILNKLPEPTSINVTFKEGVPQFDKDSLVESVTIDGVEHKGQ